jgi:hypothetical protein
MTVKGYRNLSLTERAATDLDELVDVLSIRLGRRVTKSSAITLALELAGEADKEQLAIAFQRAFGQE